MHGDSLLVFFVVICCVMSNGVIKHELSSSLAFFFFFFQSWRLNTRTILLLFLRKFSSSFNDSLFSWLLEHRVIAFSLTHSLRFSSFNQSLCPCESSATCRFREHQPVIVKKVQSHTYIHRERDSCMHSLCFTQSMSVQIMLPSWMCSIYAFQQELAILSFASNCNVPVVKRSREKNSKSKRRRRIPLIYEWPPKKKCMKMSKFV